MVELLFGSTRWLKQDDELEQDGASKTSSNGKRDCFGAAAAGWKLCSALLE